jgi:hypothetical protein
LIRSKSEAAVRRIFANVILIEMNPMYKRGIYTASKRQNYFSFSKGEKLMDKILRKVVKMGIADIMFDIKSKSEPIYQPFTGQP